METPAFKLYRKSDPETSKDAAESLDVTAMEAIVADAIWQFGERGCISDEVCDLLPHHRYSSVTARYKQLKEKGVIVIDDRKRKARSGRGQHIMWHKEFYHEGE